MSRIKSLSAFSMATGLPVALWLFPIHEASADEDRARLRWGIEAEFGAIASPSREDRVDVIALVGLPIRAIYDVSERVALSAGAAIPLPPNFALQVPLTAHVRPFESRLSFHAGARGIYASVALCATDADACPLQAALDDPRDRGAFAWGVVGEVGASYEWLRSRVRFRLAVSYVGGPMDGKRKNAEPARSGFYQGAVVSFGIADR